MKVIDTTPTPTTTTTVATSGLLGGIREVFQASVRGLVCSTSDAYHITKKTWKKMKKSQRRRRRQQRKLLGLRKIRYEGVRSRRIRAPDDIDSIDYDSVKTSDDDSYSTSVDDIDDADHQSADDSSRSVDAESRDGCIWIERWFNTQCGLTIRYYVNMTNGDCQKYEPPTGAEMIIVTEEIEKLLKHCWDGDKSSESSRTVAEDESAVTKCDDEEQQQHDGLDDATATRDTGSHSNYPSPSLCNHPSLKEVPHFAKWCFTNDEVIAIPYADVSPILQQQRDGKRKREVDWFSSSCCNCFYSFGRCIYCSRRDDEDGCFRANPQEDAV